MFAARFSACLSLALLAIAPAMGQAVVVKSDRQWESEGSYMVYAQPWCTSYDASFLEGRDFLDTIAWPKGSLAQGKDVQFGWRWSDKPANPRCGVKGYNLLGWANYDGGAVRSPIAPRQVGSIVDFVLPYEVEDAGGYQFGYEGYNGLGEFFLTKRAGDANSKALEIGWYFNAPKITRAWAATGRQLGTYRDRFRKDWIVSANVGGVAGMFVTFIPAVSNGRRVKATFDGSGALAFLFTAGVVQKEWWVNGAAIGVEPLRGTGTANVRYFGPSWK